MPFGKKQVNKNKHSVGGEDPKLGTETPAIPTAIVGPARTSLGDLLKGSYMWLVALACLVIAIGIVWWSTPEHGIKITISFPDGHGLKAEDEIRFRGIRVGVVEEVKLNRDLSAVGVTVNLLPFAEPLAREGTRFWIVRPELSLAGISGLETAVGHKYIGVIPGGPDGPWNTVFEGLAKSPPDALENSGVEIIVRGEQRHSVTAGSPVSYRGVVVGRVMSVALSQDGRFVDARTRIFDDSIELVTINTKFWASGGVDIEFSWTDGVKFDMESIETLAHGGISLLTTQPGGQTIKPGHVFVLHSSPEDDWFELASHVRATKIDLRGALPMEMIWQQKSLFRTTENQEGFVGTQLAIQGIEYLLIPSDRLVLPEKGTEGSLKIGFAGHSESRYSAPKDDVSESGLTRLKRSRLPSAALPKPLSRAEMRIPRLPERCMAVRANGELGDLTYLHYAIESEDISEDWQIKNFDGDRSVWHGAPVLSAEDGKLIGVLLVGEHETRIEALTDAILD